MGLATVHGIVNQNGGFITVSSKLDVGSTFTLYLPRHAGDAAEMRTSAEPEVSPGLGETVLLAEDEAAILAMATRMLRGLGYAVLPAGTAAEALKRAKEHAGPIHLLITDVVMPEMNGRELAGKIGAIRPDVKHLYMSGYSADVVELRGVIDEGTHFLQKPFSLAQLAAKVREVLEP